VPRYVILYHDFPAPHWDLFLERGGVLASWRLLAEPRPGASVPCEPAPDHRLHYLDYEGPVSGGRGSVRRVAAGNYCADGDAVTFETGDYCGPLAFAEGSVVLGAAPIFRSPT
jgi:hypothetical protein